MTLLTDFGLSDPFVGVMKGVVLSRARGSALVDLTHDIEPGRIADAAFWLAQAYPWFPAGTVHLAVVDPGVGTSREALVVRAAGHLFVGPDNGLFEVVLRRVKSFECRRMDLGRLGLVPQSSTFHGRDVFAPVAGLLASRRLDFEGIGPRHEPLATQRVPEPRAVAGGFEGEVLVVDRFGNLITNVEAPGPRRPREDARRDPRANARTRPDVRRAFAGRLRVRRGVVRSARGGRAGRLCRANTRRPTRDPVAGPSASVMLE